MKFQTANVKLALQLYSVRAAGDFAQRCDLARQAGYAWVETEVTYGLSADDFITVLDQHQLRLISMHVELSDLAANFAGLVEVLQRCGCATLVMPWLDESERPQQKTGWIRLAQQLQNYAQLLAAQGIRLAYHNHAFEMAELEPGYTVLDCLLEHAPALYWQADLAWLARARADVLALLHRYQDRLISVHVKDWHGQGASAAENDWAILGRGLLPWPDYLAALPDTLSDFIVEHDQPIAPLTMASAGIQQLQTWLAQA